MAYLCPNHSTTLSPLPKSRDLCNHCSCVGSIAVVGCEACGYGVCKWCNVGGHRLFERLAHAETVLVGLRLEIAAVKARVDGDVFVWV